MAGSRTEQPPPSPISGGTRVWSASGHIQLGRVPRRFFVAFRSSIHGSVLRADTHTQMGATVVELGILSVRQSAICVRHRMLPSRTRCQNIC